MTSASASFPYEKGVGTGVVPTSVAYREAPLLILLTWATPAPKRAPPPATKTIVWITVAAPIVAPLVPIPAPSVPANPVAPSNPPVDAATTLPAISAHNKVD